MLYLVDVSFKLAQLGTEKWGGGILQCWPASMRACVAWWQFFFSLSFLADFLGCPWWLGWVRLTAELLAILHQVSGIVLERNPCFLAYAINDGNGSGSDRVESPCIQNRNPNPNPKPIRVEIHHQNQTREYPKPEWIPETRNKYTHIHMYKQEATNNKYLHESTFNKFNSLSKQVIINIL